MDAGTFITRSQFFIPVSVNFDANNHIIFDQSILNWRTLHSPLSHNNKAQGHYLNCHVLTWIWQTTDRLMLMIRSVQKRSQVPFIWRQAVHMNRPISDIAPALTIQLHLDKGHRQSLGYCYHKSTSMSAGLWSSVPLTDRWPLTAPFPLHHIGHRGRWPFDPRDDH